MSILHLRARGHESCRNNCHEYMWSFGHRWGINMSPTLPRSKVKLGGSGGDKLRLRLSGRVTECWGLIRRAETCYCVLPSRESLLRSLLKAVLITKDGAAKQQKVINNHNDTVSPSSKLPLIPIHSMSHSAQSSMRVGVGAEGRCGFDWLV